MLSRHRVTVPRALAPLLLFLACVLGPGCDESDPPGDDTQPGSNPTDEAPLVCPKADSADVAWPKDDLPLAETPSAGTISGSFSVSAAGEARYTMPLVVPPGRAGMEPRLALTYTSSSGQGIAGMGFALEGLSAVTRCPSNLAQDGEIRAVQFNALDKLCLDGARLVEVGSAPGATGGTDVEYRTFPDTFVKVIGHFPAHTNAPLSFEVFTKSGHILEYGGTANGRAMAKGGVVASWWITSRSDRRGNAITYKYFNDKPLVGGHTVEMAPRRIEYTSHPKSPATRAVAFEYQDAPLPHTTYSGGMELRRSKLLETISMRAPSPTAPGEAEVRRYELAYDTNPATWRTVLATIAECAGNVCKPPTRFSWSQYDKALTFKQTLLPAPPPWYLYNDEENTPPETDPPKTRAHWTLADVTGDGLDDMVLSNLSMDQVNPESWFTNGWHTAKNAGTSDLFAPFVDAMTVDLKAYELLSESTPCAGDEEPPECKYAQPWWGVPFDYDMDGRKDFLLDPPDSLVPTWEVARSVGDGTFEKIDTGIPRHDEVGQSGSYMHHGSVLADVDGDGAADLIQCLNPNPSVDSDDPGDEDAEWSVHLWRPGGFDPAPIPIGPMKGRTCTLANLFARRIKLVDLDGDGKVELLVPAKGFYENDVIDHPCASQCVYTAVTYHEDGTFSGELTNLPVPGKGWGQAITFPDVNGDGLPDAVAAGFADNRFRTSLNTGKGFSAPVLSVANVVPNDTYYEDQYANLAQPFDFNGDGSMDLFVPMAGKCVVEDPDVACWVVLQAPASGDGTFDLVKTDIPFNESDNAQHLNQRSLRPVQVADLDGNGRPDLVIQDPVFFSVHMARGPQDLLLSVTDGLSPLDPGDPGFVPTVAIEYEVLVDRALTYGYAPGSPEHENVTYSSSRYDPANTPDDCGYPRHCVVGPQRVVSKYELSHAANDGSNDRPRTFFVKYRDARAHLLGRGWLGFRSKRVLDADTGAGTATFYDNLTYDAQFKTYPFAGHATWVWSWSAPLHTPGEPDRLQLGYEVTQFEQKASGGGKTYFTIPVSRDTRREEGTYPGPGQTVFQYVHETANNPALLLSHTARVVTQYDGYGNVLAETESTDGVDLTTAIARTVDNDPAIWLIGLVHTEATCSASIGKTQCRGAELERNAFGEVIKAKIGDAADPETHLTTRYLRDVFGNVVNVKAKDAFGHNREECTSYEPEGIFPFARGNKLGHLSFARFDAGLGVATAAVDVNGLVTRWGHDGFGRIAREVRADGTVTVATLSRSKNGGPWGNWWNLKSGVKVDGGAETKTEIDSKGRAVRTWTHGPSVGACDGWICDGDPWFESEILFDHLGRRVKASLPWLSGTPAAKRHDAFTHDGLGRVVKHTTPWKSSTTIRFDGNTSTATDSAGKTVVDVDALGRPVKVTDAMQGVTTYGYGPFGALWTVTRPGNATSVTERDAYGRVRTEKDPDRGTTITHYDGFGETSSLHDALGRHYAFTYDKIGRLVERVDPDGTTKWKYDTAAHGIGLLAETTSPAGHTTARTYDKLSRPRTTTLSLDGESFTTELAYDNFSRVKAIAYPTALGINPVIARRTYDDRGHLVAIHDTQQKLLWQLDEVDGAGRTTEETFGSDVHTHTEYVPEKGTTKRILATRGLGPKAIPIQDLHYAHNERLNLVSRTDALQKTALGLVKSEQFGYDELDRLACAEMTEIQIGWLLDDKRNPLPEKKKDKVFGPCDGITYYTNGNIKTKTGVGLYTYDPAQPHAAISAGSDSFAYDAVGNQRERPGAKINYTAFDLPSDVTLTKSNDVITFAYDGAQQRIKKTTPTRETIYVGGIYERVIDAGAGAEHRFYVDAGSATVVITARHHQKAEKTFVHKDLLGSADVVTNAAGGVLERRSFDAFGQRRNPAWGQPMFGSFSDDDTLGFTGHEPDDEVGLVNMRGRIYDPRIGRFLSTDPIVSRPLFSQSWNPYSYVTNNPLKWIDPSGFEGELGQATGEDGVTYATWAPDSGGSTQAYKMAQTLTGATPWNAGPNAPPNTPPATPVDDATAKAAGEPIDAAAPAPPPAQPSPLSWQALKHAVKHGPLTAPPTDGRGNHVYDDAPLLPSWEEWKASWNEPPTPEALGPRDPWDVPFQIAIIFPGRGKNPSGAQQLPPRPVAPAAPGAGAPTSFNALEAKITEAGGKGHFAQVRVVRGGETIVDEVFTSRPMRPEEAALGYPRSVQAAHTEARAMRDIPLQPGDRVVIRGTKPACNNCKGSMNDAARASNVTIVYEWPGGTWTAGGGK